MSFLQIRKEFVDIIDVDKGPCEVVALSGALETGCLCGESGDAMEISNFWFDAGDLVDVVDFFLCTWADVVEKINVGEHFSCRGNGVDGVKGLGSGGYIK